MQAKDQLAEFDAVAETALEKELEIETEASCHDAWRFHPLFHHIFVQGNHSQEDDSYPSLHHH